MEKKVLISFLGKGSFTTDGSEKPMRNYKPADYQINGKVFEGHSFISLALAKYYDIKKILIVGTVHSMWEDLYRGFYEKDGKFVLDNPQAYGIYDAIAKHCEEANSNSVLTIPHQEEIERVLGEGSKVILIKYGITEDEIKENINIILGLHQYLEDHENLIVDITHSFRSLPLFMMNLLVYLQNVSSKHITISHIHYGMFEAKNEFDQKVPIIDLRSMLEVNDWITGAYAFSMFGNTYKISSLLEKENKSVAEILRNFSDVMNLNYLYPVQGEAQKLSGIENKEYKTDLPKLIINPVVKEYVKTFKVKNPEHEQSFFQLKLADWQFKHKKYGQAYLTSNDALITYVCESNLLNWENQEERDKAKRILRGKEQGTSVTPKMKEWFNRHNARRNGIAHTTIITNNGREDGTELSVKEIINALKEDIKELKTMIK